MQQETSNHEKFNNWRTQPMYTLSEAAKLAHVSASTVRNWLRGYPGAGRDIQPLFTAQDKDRATLSFLQLIEIVVGAQFKRALGIPFQSVQSAHEDAKELVASPYPFAHARLEPQIQRVARLMQNVPGDADTRALAQAKEWPPKPPAAPRRRRSSPSLDEVLETIHQLDYLHDLASRWFPVGRDVPIVIDPQISTGLPIIVGRGVTIGAIHKRFQAGYQIAFIAEDLGLEEYAVETALRYAGQVAA